MVSRSIQQQPESQAITKEGKIQQPHVSNFGVTTDKKMQDRLDERVAQVFFACSIPFAVVEHPEFMQLVSYLPPGYSVPIEKHLAVLYMTSCMIPEIKLQKNVSSA